MNNRSPLAVRNGRQFAATVVVNGPAGMVGRKTGLRAPRKTLASNNSAADDIDDWFQSDDDEAGAAGGNNSKSAISAGNAASTSAAPRQIRRWMPTVISRRAVNAAADSSFSSSASTDGDDEDDKQATAADYQDDDDNGDTTASMDIEESMHELSANEQQYEGDQTIADNEAVPLDQINRSGFLDYSLCADVATPTAKRQSTAKRRSSRHMAVKRETLRHSIGDKYSSSPVATEAASEMDDTAVDMSLETEESVAEDAQSGKQVRFSPDTRRSSNKQRALPAETAEQQLPLDLKFDKAVLKSAKKSKTRRQSILKPSMAIVSDPEDGRAVDAAMQVNDDAYVSEPETSVKGQKQAATKAAKHRRNLPKHTVVGNLKIYNSGGLQQCTRDDGVEVKRSNRVRYKPLEYWRNERVVYGRRKSGPFPVPVIQEIIRLPEEQSYGNSQQSQSQGRKRVKVAADKSRQLILDSDTVSVHNPDTGDADVTTAVVFAPEPIAADLKPIRDSAYLLCRSVRDPFSQSAYSGMIVLPRGACKPVKTSGNVTIFGNIAVGEVHVTIQAVTHRLTRGCSFVVPRGATYEFENKTSREARIFYVNVK